MSKLREVSEKERRAKEFITKMREAIGDSEKVEKVMSDENQDEILNYLEYIGTGKEYLKVPADVEIIKKEMKDILENKNAEVEDFSIKINNQKMYAEENGSIRFSDDKFFSSPNSFIESASIWRTSVKIDSLGTVSGRYSSGIGGDWASSERVNKNKIKSEVTDGASFEDTDIVDDSGNPFELEKGNKEDVINNFKRVTKLYPSLRTWFFGKYLEQVDEFIKIENNEPKKENEEIDYSEELSNEERSEIEKTYLELKSELMSTKIKNLDHMNKLMDLYAKMISLQGKSFQVNSKFVASLKHELSPVFREKIEDENGIYEKEDKEKNEEAERKYNKKVEEMSDDELADAYLELKEEVRSEKVKSNSLDNLTLETKKTITSMNRRIESDIKDEKRKEEEKEAKKPKNIIKRHISNAISKIKMPFAGKSKDDDDDAR